MIIEEPEAVFWRRYLTLLDAGAPSDPTDLEPVAMLRAVAGPDPPPLPPVIRKLVEAKLPPLEREVECAIPSQTYGLDKLRQQDAAGALERVEEWIAACSRRLYSRRHDSKVMVELITAIGLWSSVARTSGKGRTAALALSFAFQLCGPMRSTPQFAYLLWRSSLVLVDGGFSMVALAFLERAHTLFALWGLKNEEASVLISLGTHAAYNGRWSMARRCFERCLSTAVSEDQKASAISNLAWLHDRLGEPEKALQALDPVWSLVEGSSPRLRASAQWVKARALAHGNLRQQQQAAKLFSTLGPDIALYCEPLDPFLLFCDHATLLIRLDDQAGLRAAAGAVAGLLPRLESTPLYETVARKIADVMTGVAASIEEVRGLRQHFELRPS